MTYVIVFAIISALALIFVATYEVIKDRISFSLFFGSFLLGFLSLVVLIPQVLVIDRNPDMTTGVLVGIEHNPFGSYTVYIRNGDSEQRHYCMEDEDIIEFAKKHIGETVRVGWEERVGFYPVEKCSQAPIIHIERWED